MIPPALPVDELGAAERPSEPIRTAAYRSLPHLSPSVENATDVPPGTAIRGPAGDAGGTNRRDPRRNVPLRAAASAQEPRAAAPRMARGLRKRKKTEIDVGPVEGSVPASRSGAAGASGASGGDLMAAAIGGQDAHAEAVPPTGEQLAQRLFIVVMAGVVAVIGLMIVMGGW